MGIAFIALGLLAAGVVGDFVVQSDLADAAGRSYSVLGGSLTLTEAEVVVGAGVVGALAAVSVLLGIGRLPGNRVSRHALKQRITELERENAAVRSRAHLVAAVEGVRRRDRLGRPHAPTLGGGAAPHREEVHAEQHA